MNSLVEFGLINGVVAAVLALAALLIGRCVRRPALIHALWILVLLKLVTPPLAGISIGLERPDVFLPTDPSASAASALNTELAADRSITTTTTSAAIDCTDPSATQPQVHAKADGKPTASAGLLSCRPDAKPEAVDLTQAGEPDHVADLPESAWDEEFSVFACPVESPPDVEAEDVVAGSIPVQERDFGARWWSWEHTGQAIFFVWLLGAAVWYLRQGWRIYCFSRFLSHGLPAPEDLQAQTRELARTMGLRRCPQVVIVPGCVSPMLWAVGRAKLLFPAELLLRLRPEARATLLSHELAHYHRGDHWVRVLEFVVGGLYWWHPVVWWARREIEAAEEECCDAWVVDQFPEAPRCYAEALLDTVDFLAEAPTPMPAAASGLGEVPFLKKRLTWIMRGVAPKAMSRAGRLTVALSAAVLLPLFPVFNDSASTTAEGALAVAYTDFEPLQVDSDLMAEPVPPSPPSEPAAVDRPVNPEPVNPVSMPVDLPSAADSAIWATVPTPNGRSVIIAAQNRVYWEHRETGATSDLTPYGVTSVAFAPDSATFVSGGRDSLIRVWNASTGELETAFEGHVDVVRSVAFSPDGRYLVSGSQDGMILLWNLSDGRTPVVLSQRTAAVSCLRFSPDGRLLVAASGDWALPSAPGEIAVFEMPSRVPRLTFACDSPPGAVAFQGDGETLAVADWRGLISFWNASTGLRLVPGYAQRDKNDVSEAQFSPNVRTLDDVGFEQLIVPFFEGD